MTKKEIIIKKPPNITRLEISDEIKELIAKYDCYIQFNSSPRGVAYWINIFRSNARLEKDDDVCKKENEEILKKLQEELKPYKIEYSFYYQGKTLNGVAELNELKFYSGEFKTKENNTKFYLPSRLSSSTFLYANSIDEILDLIKDGLDKLK